MAQFRSEELEAVLGDDFDGELLISSRTQQSSLRGSQRGFLWTVVSLCGLAAACYGVAQHMHVKDDQHVLVTVGTSVTDSITILADTDDVTAEGNVEGHTRDPNGTDVKAASVEGCGDLPFVKLTEVVSSNLGNRGPDSGPEGIIYKAKAYHTGFEHDINDLEIHVHSLSKFQNNHSNEEAAYDEQYRPAFTTGEYVNGMHGRFAAISVKQNESVKVMVHAYDAIKKVDIPLPHSAISFFDLDTGADNNHSVEHVKVRAYKNYFVTNATEVNITEVDGFTVFTATREGTGADNPADPTELTELQKNRAITVEYLNTDKIEFEVGASPGKTGRVFSWVFRPSLLCAKTKMPDGSLVAAKGQGAPIVPVQHSGSPVNEVPVVAMILGLFVSSI